MKAIVDKDKCIGCGICPDVCSDIFEMDEKDDKAKAKDIEIPDDILDDALDAESECPVDAISVK